MMLTIATLAVQVMLVSAVVVCAWLTLADFGKEDSE